MLGRISEKKVVAQGTLRAVFKLDEEVNFKSGQYFFITIPKLLFQDEKGNRRQFSIVNSPNEKNILTLTTRISDSAFKQTLSQLPLGSEVELGPIAGVFTLPEDKTKPLVFIAGGIGITPFMSMLSFISEEKLPYKITLVYSNRNQASTAYLDWLQELATKLSDFKLILTMTDDPTWTGEKRMIDSTFIKEYFPNVNENFYMVVGPPGMVEAIDKSLLEAGIESDNIKKENFTGY